MIKKSIDAMRKLDKVVKGLITRFHIDDDYYDRDQYCMYCIYGAFMDYTDTNLQNVIVAHNDFCNLIRAYVNTHQIPKTMHDILEGVIQHSQNICNISSKYINSLNTLSWELLVMQQTIKYVDPNINASTESAAL